MHNLHIHKRSIITTLILGAGLLVFTGAWLKFWLYTPFFDWNATRLSHTLAWKFGYPAYYPVDSGAAFANHYGALATLLYLPCLAFKGPTMAILGGALINFFCYFLPGILLTRSKLRAGDPVAAIALLLTALFFTLYLPPLDYVAFGVTSDGPAIGLAGLAVLLLCQRSNDSTIPLLLSGLCAVAAVWCKQSIVFIIVGSVLYLWKTAGWKVMMRYTIATGIAGSLITVALFLSFNTEDMFFHMFTFLKDLPWRHEEPVRHFFIMLEQRLKTGAPLILTLAGLSAAHHLTRRADPKAKPLKGVMFCIILSLIALPTTLSASMNYGGDYNQFALPYAFILLAILLLLSDLFEQHAEAARIFTCLLVAYGTLLYAPALHTTKLMLSGGLKKNPQQLAFDYALKNPGEVYFPRQTLSTLMAEGKLYHYSWELAGRRAAGHPIGEEQFKKHLPENMQRIAAYNPEFIVGVLALPARLGKKQTRNFRAYPAGPSSHRPRTKVSPPGRAVARMP